MTGRTWDDAPATLDRYHAPRYESRRAKLAPGQETAKRKNTDFVTEPLLGSFFFL